MILQILNAQIKLESYLESKIFNVLDISNENPIQYYIEQYRNINFRIQDIHELSKWSQFFFLNNKELNQIYNYLLKHPKENTILFLNHLKEFSKEKANLIRYIILNQSNHLNAIQNKTNQFMSYLYLPSFDKQNTYKNRNRLMINQGHFSGFMQTEKDKGEYSIIDYVSGGFTYKNQYSRWYFGDFIAQFGLGMSFHQGYQPTLFNQNKLSLNGFKIHRGTNENAYLRGLATEMELKNKQKLSAFVSAKKSDGQYDQLGISHLFTDGTHNSDNAINTKNAIGVYQLGIAYSFRNQRLIQNSLIYGVHFDKLLKSYSNSFHNQLSFSHTISYLLSGFHMISEWNLDQGKYVSQLSKMSIHLGYAIYLDAYLGIENRSFKNYFRQLPVLFSTPEQFYGYKLEHYNKQKKYSFSYHRSQTNGLTGYNKKEIYYLRFDIKLKNRSRLTISSAYRLSTIEKELKYKYTGILRTRLKFQIKLRGLWNWQHGLQIKSGNENGIAYSNRFEYKKQKWGLKFGFIQYSQSAGAIYVYESDLQSMGYTKGFFRSGNLLYILIKYKWHSCQISGRIRLYNKDQKRIFGGGLGFRYKF